MTETAEPQDPRHIALFLPSLRGGGAERVMVLLANGFAARGHRVDLVLARAEGPYLDEVAAGVRIVDLARSRVLTSLWPLVRYLRRERPDAMLSAMTHANVIAIWAKMLARVPLRLVVSEHSSPSRSHAGGGMARIMRLLVRRFYGKADTIVCVSNGARDEMAALYPALSDRLTTIYNPLDLDRIQRLMEEPVSHPWLEDRDIPVVLAAGRLTAAKDYPTLLRAMAHLLGQRPARLIILGQGEEEAALRQLIDDLGIAEHVDLVGFQKNPFSWMRRCDLYVMSSAWEGLPGSLIEALACGAKVVSTDCRTGPREILEDGKWGTLVPVGDADALARAMEERLHEANSAAILSRLKEFEPAHIAQRYLESISQ